MLADVNHEAGTRGQKDRDQGPKDRDQGPGVGDQESRNDATAIDRFQHQEKKSISPGRIRESNP